MSAVSWFGCHQDIPVAQSKIVYPTSKLSRVFIPSVLKPQDMRTKFKNVCQPSWDAGVIPVVSFKPDPTAAANGSWDAHLTELGLWLSAQKDVKIILNHEPENDYSGKTFQGMFNRCYDVLKTAHHKTQVIAAYMAYQWRPGSSTTKTPADWKVNCDRVSCDVYSGVSFPVGTILPEHPGFTRWRTEIAGDAPWMLTERGFAAASSQYQLRADTIRREADWLAVASRQGCSSYLGWDSGGTEANANLKFDPLATAAMQYLASKIG